MTKSLAFVAIASAVWCGCAAPPGESRRGDQWVEPGTGMTFVRIESGSLMMGAPPDEAGREAQEIRHRVELSRPFWLGVFEVTQREWQRVMDDNPSHFRGDDRLPVESVTWFDVQAFLDRLTKRSPGNRFRLPTEAEWEYACRAGTETAYNTGPSLSPAQANVAESMARTVAGEGRTLTVGSFAPNAWGLHDMHGNVWEWTEDEHCPYASDPAVDPIGRCGSPLKVIRGGSWYFDAGSARCALRYTHRPQDLGFSLGFRVVREPAPAGLSGRQ
jgi:formylglycine-generating enzyme required for sulfatase activity